MQYCQRCTRAGDDLGDCSNFALGCPAFKEVDPLKHVVIRCSPCDKTRVIEAAAIMQGKSRLREQCPRTDCACVVMVLPKKKAAPIVTDSPPDDVQ